MTQEAADRLALAVLEGFQWAVRGGEMRDLPRIAQGLSDALFAIGQQPPLNRSGSQDWTKDMRRATAAAALEQCQGNTTEAAKLLGVTRTTIYRALRNGHRKATGS